MSKRSDLNINLGFTADTSQAKAQLKDLQKQLSQLINNPIDKASGTGLTKEIKEASVAAASLKHQLQSATNVNTGKLDLGRLSQSLRESGASIEQYKDALLTLGSDGLKTFSAITQAITTAEVPLKRSNKLVEEFGITLKNTAKWQISSTLLHGFIGSVQNAFSYVKDLNQALNDIRIVTNQSVDQMADFAIQANQAAKALNTTTMEYANASLIFFQQGLDTDAVTKRTEAVIKMANVTGESAEDISSYMTAIWNNFSDGSTKLEKYADVITALGASTASSSEEIAEGLSKFAAVADTIGLSYEYATSMLATLVANTRQSADVVGTSLRTILARLQSVKLGETLEDGVELTQYTAALEKIGVEVLDLNGDLKEADDILEATAARWDTLTRAQQSALAQTLAGSRQYAQFIAIMDNWGEIVDNAKIAENSEGTLQQQAEVYAESWEAARHRVRAAAEDIYDAILNDKFFIGLNNAFAGVLDTINNTIKGVGGLKGVLFGVGSAILSLYGNQISESLENLQYRIMMNTEKGRQAIQEIRTEFNNALQGDLIDQFTTRSRLVGEVYKSQAKAQADFLISAREMNTEQKAIAQILLDQHKTLVDNAAAQKEIADRTATEAANQEKVVQAAIVRNKGLSNKIAADGVKNIAESASLTASAQTGLGGLLSGFRPESFTKTSGEIAELRRQLQGIRLALVEDEEIAETFGEKIAGAFLRLENAAAEGEKHPRMLRDAFTNLFSTIDKESLAVDKVVEKIKNLVTNSNASEKEIRDINAAIDTLIAAAQKAGVESGELVRTGVNAVAAGDKIKESLSLIPSLQKNNIRGFLDMTRAVSSLGMAISSVTGLIDTWNNKDMSGGQKLLATITTLSFVIPSLITSFGALQAKQVAALSASVATALGFNQETVAALTATGANGALTASIWALLLPLGIAAAAIGGVVLVLYALVKAGKEAEAAKPQGMLKAAAEAAREAADAANKAADAYRNISSALDELDKKINAIQNLGRGTLEWKNAILESNRALIDLLDTYNLLKEESFTTDEDGLMHLKETAKEDILQKSAANIGSAENMNYAAKIRVNDLDSRVKASEAVSAITLYGQSPNSPVHGTNSVDLVTENSQLGADIGLAIVKELQSGGLTNTDLINNSDKLADILSKNTSLNEKEAQSVAKQISTNNELIENISRLAVEVSANTEANKILNGQIVDNAFGSKLGNTGFSDELNNKLVDAIGKDLTTLTQQKYGQKWADGLGITDEFAQKQYALAKGYDAAATENLKGNKGKYYNQDGTEVGEISDEVVRRFLAQQEAIESMQSEVQGYIDTLQQTIEMGNKISEGIGEALGSFTGGMGGNLSSLTGEQKESFKNNIGEYDSKTDSFSLGENTINAEVAQKNGYATAEAYYNALQSAMVNYDEQVAAITSNTLSKVVVGAFESIESQGSATLATRQAVASLIEDAFISSGREGSQKIADFIDNKVSDINGFIDALKGIDWNSVSPSELISTLEEVGVTTDMTTDELKEFVDIMKRTGESTVDATERFAEIQSVLKNLQSGNNTISAEDYDKLKNDYGQFFMAVADGTYKLITDAQTFYDMVNSQTIQGFEDNIKKIQYLQQSGYTPDELSSSGLTGEKSADGIALFSSDKVKTQLNFLDMIGYDSKEFAEWTDAIATGENITVDMIDKIGAAVNENKAKWGELSGSLEENQEKLASTATSLGELHSMLEKGTIEEEAFTKAAIAMDNETDLQSLNKEELREYSEYLRQSSKDMDDFNSSMSNIEAQTVAKGIMKMNDGVEKLNKNFKEWRSKIEDAAEGTEDFYNSLDSTREAVSELLDVSKDYVSDDFVVTHLEEIQAAAEGDADAIDNLKAMLLEDIVANITISNNLDEVGYDLAAAVDNLQSLIPDDLTIGATLDDTGFVEEANKLIQNAGLTADQVNALFDTMGFETNFAVEHIPVKRTGHEVITRTTVLDWAEAPMFGGGIQRFPSVVSTRTDAGAPYDYTEYVDAVAMQSSADGSKKPKISGITKKAGGSKANKPAPAKSGGGGGKKGGGGKEKKPDTKDKKDPIKGTADRYHDLNESLQSVTHTLSLLDKTQNKVFGKQLISNLMKQNKLLERQRDIYDKINAELKVEQGELKEKLGGYGFKGNTDSIQNYKEVYENIKAKYNAAVEAYNATIDQYNTMSGEAQQEAGKTLVDNANKTLESAKKDYDEAMDWLKRYDAAIDELQKNEEKQQELLYKQIENNLTSFKVQIDLALDTSAAQRALNKFLKAINMDIKNLYKTTKEWGDVFNTSLKDANTYWADSETKISQLEKYKEAYENQDWGSNSSMFATETELLKAITDLEQEIIKDSENILQLYQEAYNNLKDAFKDVADQFEDIIDNFDKINDTLDHYEKVISALNGGGDYDSGRQRLDMLYKIRQENSLITQKALQEYIQSLEQRKREAIAAGYEVDDSYIKDIENQIKDANSKLTSEIEKYLDTIQKQLENTVKMVQSSLDKKIWGKSTDDVSRQWENKKKQAEGYYDTVERVYQLESLERKWKSAINNTTSLKTQQQLTELMEKQVKSLESKKALSEKDIELAEKELQVYQAQAALEDAQNAKNAIKLTRDESGNWSYQYVADQDDIASKQQDLLDKVNEWRTASINAAEEIAEKTLAAYQDFSTKMAEIMSNVALSEQERNQQIQELNETYWGKDGVITKAVEDSNYIQGVANRATYTELQTLYLADQENFAQMKEAEQEIVKKMNESGVNSYSALRDFIIGDDGKSGVYGDIKNGCIEANKDSSAAWSSFAADAIGYMYKNPDSVKNMIESAYKDMQTALNEYNKSVTISEQASGREWSKVEQQLSGVRSGIDLTKNKIDEVVNKISSLSTFENKVLEIGQAWQKVAADTRAATEDMMQYLSLLGYQTNTEKKQDKPKGKIGESAYYEKPEENNSNSNENSGNLGSTTGTLDNDTAWGIAAAIWTERGSGWNNNPTRKKRLNEKFGAGAFEQVQAIINAHSANGDLYRYWKNNLGGNAKKFHYSSFDTGGYTGDWGGDDGRFAMLHSKELVLNKDDTKNILEAVNMIRQAKAIEKNLSASLSGMMAGLSVLGKNNLLNFSPLDKQNNSNNTFEINMTVDGGDVQEIQRAILELPNLASQYLGRD